MTTDAIKFVDEYEKPLAPQNTWASLSIDELIATKGRMIDMLYAVKSDNTTTRKMILEAIQELDSRIL